MPGRVAVQAFHDVDLPPACDDPVVTSQKAGQFSIWPPTLHGRLICSEIVAGALNVSYVWVLKAPVSVAAAFIWSRMESGTPVLVTCAG